MSFSLFGKPANKGTNNNTRRAALQQLNAYKKSPVQSPAQSPIQSPVVSANRKSPLSLLNAYKSPRSKKGGIRRRNRKTRRA